MKSENKNVRGTASLSFDERFPDAEPGYETEEGMAKAFADFECDICGRRTPWFHFKMAVYLCSQNCLTRYQATRR